MPAPNHGAWSVNGKGNPNVSPNSHRIASRHAVASGGAIHWYARKPEAQAASGAAARSVGSGGPNWSAMSTPKRGTKREPRSRNQGSAAMRWKGSAKKMAARNATGTKLTPAKRNGRLSIIVAAG